MNSKNLLVGNGINIQFDKKNYTPQQIVLRILKNCDSDDFPSHIIVDSPYLLKNYLGELYLKVRDIISGAYDKYAISRAEKDSLKALKKRYSDKISELRITDIGFEDYYLIHDLVCHEMNIHNPEQFNIRESMKIAYFHAIYNNGELNKLHTKYPSKFIGYLNGFENIFTTNYDCNIESVTRKDVFHIHGQFDRKADVYNVNSFRNQLPDCPIKDIEIDDKYYYLYSNALSTHCGEYKEFQIKQNSLANNCIAKMAEGYSNNPNIKREVDNWIKSNNSLTSNLGYAIQLKVKNPQLNFSENYYFDNFKAITGTLEIIGLSPHNDYHIFECIDKSQINECIYYYYDEAECKILKDLLPILNSNSSIKFESVSDFWRLQNEN